MKFSLVTISFNQASFIEQAISSVINQQDIDLEYIVIDAGSTDGSRDIILKYADKIDKIIFEKDEGPAHGLNKGFSFASGDIFGYLNSDDMLEPDALKKVKRCFSRYQNADIVAGHCYIINEIGQRLHKGFSHKITVNSYLRGHGILIQQSTFFRRSIFEKVGGFNVQNKVSWDGEIILDMLRSGAKLKILNDVLSSFRIYQGSVTGSSDYLIKLNNEMERLRQGSSHKEDNFILKYVYYTLHWLAQPSILRQRLIDQVKHPKRVI